MKGEAVMPLRPVPRLTLMLRQDFDESTVQPFFIQYSGGKKICSKMNFLDYSHDYFNFVNFVSHICESCLKDAAKNGKKLFVVY